MRSYSMVEETTNSIASSGAGAVTLIAITGYPRFSSVFGTQATTVRYIIEDTVNNKWEIGIGSVSSNVLTRSRPQVTWNGTTLSDQNPSALAFTGSPSSGDIKIRIGAFAEDSVIMPARQSTVNGDSTWLPYPVSSHYYLKGNGTGVALTAGREYYQPYLLPFSGSLSGAQFDVTTAVASSNMKWALYAIGYDGLPGNKIVDFTTQATATTGVKTDTATASWSPAGKVYLNPGWYYTGFIPSHAISIRCNNQYTGIGFANPVGRANAYGEGPYIYVAGNYATGLPALPSLGSASMGDPGVNDFFWMGLKVVP